MTKEDLADAPDIYFGEITRIVPERPLLTHKQEIKLGQKIEAGRSAQEQLNGNHLSEQRRQELGKVVREALEARDFFAESNLRLVFYIAGKFSANRPWLFREMVQAGNLGLMEAINKYDWRKGSFGNYAGYWIKREVHITLGDQYSLSLGNNSFNDLIKVRQQRERFFNINGSNPSDEEIAKIIGIPVLKVKRLLDANKTAISLDNPSPNSGDTRLLEEILPDVDELPEAVILQKQRKEKIESLFWQYLNPRQERILKLRFGFKDGNCYSFREIGERFGLSKERIRQIINEAFEVLKQPEVLEKFKQG